MVDVAAIEKKERQQIRARSQEAVHFLKIKLILLNKSALTNLQSLSHTEFHFQSRPRLQDAETPSLSQLQCLIYSIGGSRWTITLAGVPPSDYAQTNCVPVTGD
jgi:hypothetical protein